MSLKANGGDATATRQPVTFAFASEPDFGTPEQVAEGVWWIRLPTPLAIDHVNVYLLEGSSGWTLVDAGVNDAPSRDALTAVLERPEFNHKPLDQVVITHFHPDHIGLTGYFTGPDYQARLLTSRTSWQTAGLLLFDNPDVPCGAHIAFYEQAGMKGIELESFKRRAPSSYSDNVGPLPESYTRLVEGQELKIGGRVWTVRMGHGHAAEHVTLWSDDNLAVVGDQILPSISPNLTVHFSEPEADCVSEWLESCDRFEQLANDNLLCLPGHNRPFTGAPFRCRQLAENCLRVISRIESALTKSQSAMDLMPVIYRRDIAANEKTALIGETMGYLNHLYAAGKIRRRLVRGQYLWRCQK